MNRIFISILVIISVLVASVVGVGIFLVYQLTNNEQTEDSVANNFKIGENSIHIHNQNPGRAVAIEFVDLISNSYVIIHEGEYGSIIGNSDLLSPGESREFSVEVARDTVEGETLFGMIHSDDGDGEFNSSEDFPIRDEQGDIIFVRFFITNNVDPSI